MPRRPRDRVEAERIDAVLTDYHTRTRPLPGIQGEDERAAFLDQLFDSIHRVQFIERGVLLRQGELRELSPKWVNPAGDLFDPVRAAAIRVAEGEHDEACWFVFLFAHFGKHLKTGYRLTRDVYGSLGKGPIWDWVRISSNPEEFRRWLAANINTMKNDGVARRFGNHRKYESLESNDGDTRGTAAAFVTYVRWVDAHRNHHGLFEHAAMESGHDPRRTFDFLYRSMKDVASFGRTARFDYLTMLGKLDLAEIEPGSTYMTGATGPLAGAQLLFGNAAASVKPREIDRWLIELEATLGLPMGMQILEDSLCNWQKSPAKYVPFRG